MTSLTIAKNLILCHAPLDVIHLSDPLLHVKIMMLLEVGSGVIGIFILFWFGFFPEKASYCML